MQIDFLKNQFFPQYSFAEKVDAVQKYLLWKSSSSFFDMFILNSSSGKIAVPKSNCCKEPPILKKWLLYKIFALKKKLFWKNNSCEKVTSEKGESSSCSEEIAAPKK